MPAIALTTIVAVAGYAVIFLIAARTTGVTTPFSRLLPLALLAILAMVLPSIAGWGPREGATAWVFAAAGLGADRGAAVDLRQQRAVAAPPYSLRDLRDDLARVLGARVVGGDDDEVR